MSTSTGVKPALGEVGSSARPSRPSRPLTTGIIGVVLCLLAAFLVLEGLGLDVPAVGVGPAPMLYIVAGLLVLLGVGHLIMAMWQHSHPVCSPSDVLATPPSPFNLFTRSVCWVLAGIVSLIVVLHFGGGFIVGASVLFSLTAHAFKSGLSWRAPLFGLILSVVVHLFFTHVLTLNLPTGVLERLLQFS